MRINPAFSEFIHRRTRRRGPRSQLSRLRRSIPRERRALPGTCHGEAGHFVPDSVLINSPHDDQSHNSRISRKDICDFDSHISIFLINIQCLMARIHELSFHLEKHKLDIVCIQETWLEESIEDPRIPGYEVCSRRDRHVGANRGGVLTLQR